MHIFIIRDCVTESVLAKYYIWVQEPDLKEVQKARICIQINFPFLQKNNKL
jgi:hypothetical protein